MKYLIIPLIQLVIQEFIDRFQLEFDRISTISSSQQRAFVETALRELAQKIFQNVGVKGKVKAAFRSFDPDKHGISLNQFSETLNDLGFQFTYDFLPNTYLIV